MELFTLFGKIAVNDKDANKSIDNVTGRAKQAEGQMGSTFGKIGKAVTTAFTVAAVGAFEKKIVDTYSTYDDQMRKVQAVSGATGKAYQELRAKAEELGAKTRFSATEAGQGMENLARAGWKTGQIMSGIGPVLSFATANAIDLGSAAGIVADGLSQFGLQAQDTGMFTDVLSATAAAANTDIGLLGETLKYAGAPAGALGYKLQDVAVAMGLMANKGIKGSQAGTTLRSAMTRLANPTGESAKAMKKLGISITDSSGKVKPFATLMQDLRGKFSKLNDAQKAQMASTIFGQEAMSGMLAVVNSSDEEFNKMTNAIKNCDGQTQKMADTMDGGLGGAIASVKSAWEGFLIKLGNIQDGALVDVFNGLAHVLQELPDKIEYISNKFKEFNNFLKEHKTTIKTLGIIFGVLMSGFVLNSLKLKIAEKGVLGFIKTFSLIKNLGGIISTLGSFFTFLISPVGLVTLAVAAFAAVAYLIYSNWSTIGPWLADLWNNIKETAINVWNGICEATSNAWNSICETISNVWESIVTTVSTFINTCKEIVLGIWNSICEVTSTAWEFIKNIVTVGVMTIASLIEAMVILISTPFMFIWENIKEYVFMAWEYIKEVVSTGINYVSNIINTVLTIVFDTFSSVWNSIFNVCSTVWNTISSVASTVWNMIKTFFITWFNWYISIATNIFNKVLGVVTVIWNNIKNAANTVWNAIKTFFITWFNWYMSIATSIFNSVKNIIANVWNTIKSITSSVWNSIRSVISSVWNTIKSVVSDAINGVKSKISNVWDSIKSITSNVWNGIKEKIQTPIRAATEFVSEQIEKIKNFFGGLHIQLPHIKLPHFKLSGEFSLMPPSVPHLGVDWYAEGGILTKPTMFGMRNGRPQVGGEAGPEAVLPIEKLGGILADTLRDIGYGGQQPIIINIDGREVFNAMSPYMASAVRGRR